MTDRDRILSWIIEFESKWSNSTQQDDPEYRFRMEQLIDRIRELLINQ